AGVCGTVDAHRVSLPIVGDRADQPALPEDACQLAAPEGGGIEGRCEALVRDPRPVRDRRYQELIATDLTSVVRSATPGEDPDGAVEVDRAALRRVGQEGVMAIPGERDRHDLRDAATVDVELPAPVDIARGGDRRVVAARARIARVRGAGVDVVAGDGAVHA